MYRIIGADGKEYGPISETQLRQWITEGRVNAQTRVLVEGTADWKTVADLPELASAIPGAAAPAAPPPPMTSIPVMPGPGLYSPATDQVNGPAIGLIIVGALYILGCLFSLVVNLGHFGSRMMSGNSDEFSRALTAFTGPISIILNFIGLVAGALIVFGGVKMKSLQSYGLCMTASIVAMLPFSCCCIIGLPIGIWSLVVLSKPEVKSAFQ